MTWRGRSLILGLIVCSLVAVALTKVPAPPHGWPAAQEDSGTLMLRRVLWLLVVML